MSAESFLKIGSIVSLDEDKFLVGFGPREWLPRPGTFYFPDFFLKSPTPWCHHEHTKVLKKEELIEILLKHHKEVPIPSWQNAKSDAFFESFDEVKSGRLKKIVPYAMTSSNSQMTPELLCHCILHALTKSDKLHLYGFWNHQGGIFGASPEMLFKMQGNKLQTVAIAGTADNAVDPQLFFNDPKEIEEHQIVVDAIRESLRLYGKITIGERTILKLTTLSHLMTPISLELGGVTDVSSLVTSLHPTPALGASPREEGMEWLRYYQTRVPRNHYGAPLGYCYGNTIACIVAIRNIQWSNRGMAIAAGCGVTQMSNPEREWNELQLKTKAVQQTLGLLTSSLPVQLSNVLSIVE